jgi:tripartite-type tricarboxylate transporter receptor subunit TctC
MLSRSQLDEHIRAGKLRALAVTTAKRSEALPDIPDRGRFPARLRDEPLVASARRRNTPADIIDKLNREINAGLADPKIKARLADLDGTVLRRLARRFRQAHRDETEKWGKVIRRPTSGRSEDDRRRAIPQKRREPHATAKGHKSEL